MGLRNGTIFTIAILIISALIALRHLLQSSIYAANGIPLIAIIAILCAAANCRIIRNRKKNLPQSIAAMFARFVDCRSDFRAIDDACITFA